MKNHIKRTHVNVLHGFLLCCFAFLLFSGGSRKREYLIRWKLKGNKPGTHKTCKTPAASRCTSYILKPDASERHKSVIWTQSLLWCILCAAASDRCVCYTWDCLYNVTRQEVSFINTNLRSIFNHNSDVSRKQTHKLFIKPSYDPLLWRGYDLISQQSLLSDFTTVMCNAFWVLFMTFKGNTLWESAAALPVSCAKNTKREV